MAKHQTDRAKNQRLNEIIILVFVIVSSIMIIIDIGMNVSAELETLNSGAEIISSTPAPSPTPTLSPEELREILRQNPTGPGGA